MLLPSIKNATFTLKVREHEKSLKIRRMIVAESKAIQQATDLGGESDIALTIAAITDSCTNGVISATGSPQYLLDFVFLQIYINSVENKIASKYTCYGYVKDPETGEQMFDVETGDVIRCNASIDVKIPLDQAVLTYPDLYEESRIINLSDDVKLKLRGLSLQENIDIAELQKEVYSIAENLATIGKDDESEDILKNMADNLADVKKRIAESFFYYSVDSVITPDAVLIPETDFNQKSFMKWIDECPANSLSTVDTFYNNLPYLGLTIDIECPQCGNKHSTKLRGLKDFFS